MSKKSKEDKENLKDFEEYHYQKEHSDRMWDSYLEIRKNRPSWEKDTHLAYKGIKKQYPVVDPQDQKQRKSFLEHIHFHKTGNLKATNNQETHLAIVRECYAGDEERQTTGKWFGKLGDIGAILAEKSPHPFAKVLKEAWTIFGDDIKDIIEGNQNKKFPEVASQYLHLYGNKEAALSAFMKEFPISDEPVQKALWELSLKNQKNQKMSNREAKESTQQILSKIQSEFSKQAKNGQINKEEILKTIEAEIKKNSIQLSGSVKDLTQQVMDLSDQFSEHLETLKEVKQANSNFVYTENEIKGLATCAQFLGQIAVFIKSPELGRAAHFVQGIAGIADSINKVRVMTGAMELAGGYAGVGIAVFGLVASFMDQGPSGDQLILESINKLAEYVAGEFEKVHQELYSIHRDMIQGFNTVLEACQKIFDLSRDTLKAVHEVGDQIGDFRGIVLPKLEQISAEINVLHDLTEKGFYTIASEPFEKNLFNLHQLSSGQSKEYFKIQGLMSDLAGYYSICRSPIDYYTGNYYFDTSIFQELASTSPVLFFSADRIIDTQFITQLNRHTQATRIGRIIKPDDLSKLLGFFARYANNILIDQYMSLAEIQQEAASVDSAIQDLDAEIKSKEETIVELSKKQDTETEKKQLEQDRKNLAVLKANRNSHEERNNQLIQLKIIAEKAKEQNDAYQKGIDEQIAILNAEQKKLDSSISNEESQLQGLETGMRMLHTGFDFLYRTKTASELSNLVMLYQDIYENHLHNFSSDPLPWSEAAKILLSKKLGLMVNDNNSINFTPTGSDLGVSPTERQISVYEKAFKLLTKFIIQKKKIKALELENELLGQEKARLKASLSLASAYHRKQLTDQLVFNSKLWIFGVHTYLDVIQNQKLSSYYTDNHLENAHQLIVMGKNFLHFINALRDNPILYEELWRAYANTLLSIYSHYQHEWKSYFNTSQSIEAYHKENEIIVNPKLVLDEEVNFAEKMLKDGALGEMLVILDAQKTVLKSFYQLIRPNKKVMSIVNKLWDQTKIRNQLGYLKQKQRAKAKFTTLEVYQYLNKAWLDISTYHDKKESLSDDFIGTKNITSLVAHLEWYVGQVAADTQRQLFDLRLSISMDALPVEHIPLDQSKQGEIMMRDRFECLLDSALQQADMKNTEKAEFFFGLMRAGKSTFIAYLLGCKMEREDKGTSKPVYIAKDCPENVKKVPVIGHKRKAQTIYPNGYESTEGDIFIDFPGMGDPRNTDEALLGVLATQVAIRTTQFVKRIFVVVEHNDITAQNAVNLAKLVSSLSKLFKDFNSFKDKITLVVSKLQPMDKEEPLDKQKLRIKNDLKEFQSVFNEEGNYNKYITDPELAKDFLSIFINGNNNLILFDPTNSKARDDLLKQLQSNQKFSSDEIDFLGDDDHREEFFNKIQDSLQQGVNVLKALSAYPAQKKKLDDELEESKGKISSLDGEINKLQQASAEEPIVIPYTEQEIEAKSNEIDKEIDNIDQQVLPSLIADEAILKYNIAEIEKRTDLVKDEISWYEEHHYPGGAGYPVSHQERLIRQNKNPFTKYTLDYFDVCDRRHVMYTVVDGICASKDDADNYKDNTIRCFTERHVIVGTHWTDCWLVEEFGRVLNIKPNAQVRSFIKNGRLCEYRHSLDPTHGYTSDSKIDPSQGIYEITYHSPNACYGHIKVTFEIAYRDQPHIIDQVKGYKRDLSSKQQSISEKHTQKKEAKATLIQMKQQKQQAEQEQQESKRRTKEKENILRERNANLAKAKNEESKIIKQLDAIKAGYDINLKIYCSNQAFWQRLIDFNKVIKFDFKQYKEFDEQFSAVQPQIAEKDCQGLVEPLDCLKFEEQTDCSSPAETSCDTNDVHTVVFTEEGIHSANSFGVAAAEFKLYEVQDPLPLLLKVPTITMDESKSQTTEEVHSKGLVVMNSDFDRDSRFTNYSIPFDQGAWDPVIQKDTTTGEPIFIYRVYQNGKEVGSASFYKHPLLCRSEVGDGHNIIATSGVLSQFNVDVQSLEEICAALPPTIFDRIVTNSIQGAKHGAIRGFSNVVGYTLQARNTPPQITHAIQQVIYYGGYFLLRYHEYAVQEENINWQSTLNVIFKAACDTGSILMMNTVVNWFSRTTHKIGQRACQRGWAKTGKMFKLFSDIAPYGVYAYNAKRGGVMETVTSIAAGTVTQTAIEETGKLAVHRFLRLGL